jgi:hypothetical protein
MNELLAERIAWRRKGVDHHYVGVLAGRPDGLVLTGREPATGIEVVLTIPFPEIEDVHLASGDEERLVGEPAVVLELAESAPILLREIGLGQLRPKALALRLAKLVAEDRYPLTAVV